MDSIDYNNAYERINSTVGNDFRKISLSEELLKSLNKEKLELEFKLKTIQNEIPKQIDEINIHINRLQLTISDINKDINILLGDEPEYCDDNRGFQQLEELCTKKRELAKQLHYHQIIHFIDLTKTNLKKHYLEENYSMCTNLYQQLCSFLQSIFDSECNNIKKYLINIIEHWHKCVKKKLTEEYAQLMKDVGWPFVTRNNLSSIQPSDEHKVKFQQFTKLLLEVELPEKIRPKPIIDSSILIDFPLPSLPITLLLEPLRKRFTYHFCGNRKTNRPDKPEWMFSQILTWIRDHEFFLFEWLQPIFDGFTISLKVQFVSNLVKMATEKLQTDLKLLQYDDALFTHTLDETLAFNKELTGNYDYPSSCPSVLSVLTQAQIFIKWINMEKKCAEKRLDDILHSSTAWTVVTEDAKCKVTECGDKFIILLSSVTDRYSALPQPGHRLQFLDFQLDLIDDFRLRLAQLKRDDTADILESDLPGILNTVHYLRTVLMEWATNTHFLILCHFKNQINAEQDFDEDSVFSDTLNLLNHFQNDELISEICVSVMMEIRARSRAYRKDRWNSMPQMDTNSELSLTISGCAMFQVLASKLHQLCEILAPEIFKTCWRYIADNLSKLIVDDVILVNTFSKGGAQQIKFDVCKNILPLFAQYTLKPEAYFKSLIEACELLCLDICDGADNVPFKVTCFNRQQVECILNRKSNLAVLDSYS